MPQCQIMLDDRPIGRVSWRSEGGRMAFEARCPMEEGYIYRLQLLGSGATLTLGVMMPEGEYFSLKRSLPVSRCPWLGEQAEARIIRSLPGEEPTLSPCGPLARYRPAEPGLTTGDAELDTAIARLSGVLYLRQGQGMSLAYPLALGQETPFAAYLSGSRCITTSEGLFGLLTVEAQV